ncbi:MAG: TraI/MobA(P) family conjugative relaxase [Thiomonas sp.]
MTPTTTTSFHLILSKVHPERAIVTGPPRFDYALLHRLAREVELDQGWSHDKGAYVVTEPNPGMAKIMPRYTAIKMGLWKEDEDRRPNFTHAARMAAEHIGGEPFQVWVAGEPAKDLRSVIHQPGASWQSVHDALAMHGIRIEAKGSGLIVTTMGPDGEVLAAKASQLGRWASKAALEKKLGPFRGAAENPSPPQAQTYMEHTHRTRAQTDSLVSETEPDPKRAARREECAKAREELSKRFEAERREIKARRARQRAGLRDQHLAERKQLQIDLQQERKAVIEKDKAEGVPFKVSQSLFAYRAAMRREELQKRQAAERKEFADEMRRTLDWRTWLENQAEHGDEAAKAALRGMRYREQRKSKKYQLQDGLEGEELDLLRKLTVAAFDAQIDHKRQLVIYRGQDGREKFTDTGPRILMHDKGPDSLEAALRIAAQKYGGKVDITGSSEFRERAAREAVRLGITVINDDLQAIVTDAQAQRMPRKPQARLSPGSGDNRAERQKIPTERGQVPGCPKNRQPTRHASGRFERCSRRWNAGWTATRPQRCGSSSPRTTGPRGMGSMDAS